MILRMPAPVQTGANFVFPVPVAGAAACPGGGGRGGAGAASTHPLLPPAQCPQPPPARPQSEPDHPAAGQQQLHHPTLAPGHTSSSSSTQLLASCSCMCWAGLAAGLHTAPRCWSRRARWQAAVSWPSPGRPQLP